MCGIAGLISFSSSLDPELIGKMTSLLRHRGPDDEGYLAADFRQQPVAIKPLFGTDSIKSPGQQLSAFDEEANVFLGHRRLAILDLSASGHQPMKYREGLWIVFNGEIYNYFELRRELKARGYIFNTGTDTEVILAA